VKYSELQDADAELLVLETGYQSTAVGASLRTWQIDALQADGHTLIGYLNVAVTDHFRAYWQSDWTTGVTTGNPDVDPINTGAADLPAWLSGAEVIAGNDTTGEQFGYIVDFTQQSWLDDVLVPYALQMIRKGWDGLFLDDVGRYFEDAVERGAPLWMAARDMMQLVVSLGERIDAANLGVTAEELTIVVNRDAFIINNYIFGPGRNEALDFDLINDFRALVDGLVTENATENPDVPNFWAIANTWFNGTTTVFDTFTDPATVVELNADTTQLFAIEDATLVQDIDALYAELQAEGVTLFLSSDQAYDRFQTALQTGDETKNRIEGTAEANVIIGLGGRDRILGQKGDDLIFGGDGKDRLQGGRGEDTLYGGAGSDRIEGGSGDDLIVGADGFDIIYGGKGNDTIIGGPGDDLIIAGDGDDVIYGGGGDDTIIGGSGNDTIFGGSGTDSIDPGTGVDVVDQNGPNTAFDLF